jgi:hypothetical protein
MDHKILLNKIDYYGVKGVFFSLIKSYLENRYQRVKYKKLSDWKKIIKGVPQGSILGPLLFLIYQYQNTIQYNTDTISIYTCLLLNGPCVTFFYMYKFVLFVILNIGSICY